MYLGYLRSREGKMSNNKNSKVSGYLFIASGITFALAAMLSHQISYFGISAMFICLGVAFIIKHKRGD